MTKNDWIKDILCDYMDIDVLDYLMKEELVDQIKKYFDGRKIKIFDITEDINNINYIMVTKDDMPIAFKTFDSMGYKIDVVDINALINSNFQVEVKNCVIEEKDDKIEELSTKLAEVVVDRNDLDERLNKAYKSENFYQLKVDSLEEDKKELSDKLSTAIAENVNCEDKVEDLESTIEGQKEQIAGLENEVKDLKIRENGLSNQLYWYKLADGATSCKLVAEGVTVVRSDYYEQLKEELEKHKRSTKENCQLRLEIEKLKERLSPTSDKEATKGPDKMLDYEGFRRAVEEAQRKMMEEQKKFPIPVFKLSNDYKTSMGDVLQ